MNKVSAINIIKANDHYIGYNYDSTLNEAKIKISWDKVEYKITYRNGIFFDEFSNVKVKCPSYAVISLIYTVISLICQKYKYPTEWVSVEIDGNSTVNLFFDVESDNDVSEQFFSLIKEIINLGLQKDDIRMASSTELLDGLNAFMTLYYGFEICEPTKE